MRLVRRQQQSPEGRAQLAAALCCSGPGCPVFLWFSMLVGRGHTRLRNHRGPSVLQQCRRPQFDSWVRKIRWRRDRLPTPVFLGFPCGSAGKESTCNVGDLGSIPGFGRSPGAGKGYPPQYSGLENSMDCIVHGVSESDTTEQLSLSCSMFTAALNLE